MNDSHRENPLPLVVLVAAVVVVAVVSNAPRWAPSVVQLAGRPVVVSLAGALLIFALGLWLARLVVTRRALGHRMRMLAIPADSFDPSEEAVIRFAAGLSRSRRTLRGLLDAPASAVRLVLDADPAGRLRYAVEVPGHARGALRVALAAYGGVELRDAPPSPEADDRERAVEVARAELVLARRSSEPLRAVGLDPDPLAAFARAIGTSDPVGGDTASVCIDLLPITPGKRRRLRRRLLRRARHDHQPGQAPIDALADLAAVGSRRGGGAPPAELVERWVGRQALARKLGSPDPLFEIQILTRVTSPVPGRAKAQLAAVLAAFDAFAGENHLRVSGLRIPGVAFLGSDIPGRRRFDRRLASGVFRPARRRVVTASEVAGLLKPPTTKCPAPNVVRSGGVVPPPPPGLPTFAGQPGLLPLGKVETEQGERMVGVPLRDTFFLYMTGRSRFGKTETGIGQFLHLARTGRGCLFLDPHADAIRRIKAYLTDDGLRDRVIEINLADPNRQPAWNPLAVSGRSHDRAQEQIDGLVDAFASALRWDETNTRALNLVTQAAHALVDLARRLPPELAPTIFEIPTLLGDDDWRSAVLPHVSPPTRRFFVERFPRLPAEAITPVTNLIDRLRVSPAPAALLGSPTSTYDIRAAMDRGQIVLVCPGSGSALDRLVANFVVYDLLHAAKTRADTPPERRREFCVFLDEIQIYDGASSGTLAALLEQVAKFGVRCVLLNQNPERLTGSTRDAITTNRSHLVTTALNAKAAALLARELGHGVDPEVITQQPRFHSIASVTLDGEISQPFRLHGVRVEELLPDADRPEGLVALDAAIDRNTQRAPVAQTLERLDRHPAEILRHLRHGDRPTSTGGKHRIGRAVVS